MAITFQKELFGKTLAEFPALFLAHDDEIEQDQSSPLDPDWNRYVFMELNGQLLLVTARDEGTLIGYYFAVIAPQLHRKTKLVAYSDMFYIKPEYRRGWTGIKLINETNRILKLLGVHKSYLVTKVHYPITMILKRLSYTKDELLSYILLK